MRRELLLLAMSAALATPAAAGTLTLAGLADNEDGRAVDLDGQLAVTAAWSVGAGLGHAKSTLEGDRFSATGLRLSTDVQFGGAFVTASAERWQDSGRLEAVTLRGE